MRTRSIALVVLTLATSPLLVASCGDDEPSASDPAGTPSATTPAQAPPGQPAPSDATSTPTLDPADDPTEPPQGSTKPSKDTITEAVAKNSDLTTLKTALGAAGLNSTLEQPGPYTVFAPNNDAFAKLGSKLDSLLQPGAKGELADILKFHAVSGQHRVGDLKDGELLTTVQGTRLRVSVRGNTVTVGNSLGKATIVAADNDASNGVIQVVDTVLTPKK